MRQIILDTETTGLSPALGHRIIEIGCLEMVNRQLTGSQFHTYINPEREVDEGAFAVHGISSAFLADKPLFPSVMQEFLNYIKGAELIIHNATFDVGFLNAEFARLSNDHAIEAYCSVVDTLVLAKQKHPGQRNNLDALCKRYGVNNTNRTLHGALIDAELLAFVYLAMTGGQIHLFTTERTNDTLNMAIKNADKLKSISPVRHASTEELAAHERFMTWLKEV